MRLISYVCQRIVRKAIRVASNAYLGVCYAPWCCLFLWRDRSSTCNIFTHTTRIERLLLYRLARRQAPGAVAVEIGSYLGASTCFLAAGLSKGGGEGKLVCVDTWHNDAMTEGQRDTFQEFLSNTSPYAQILVTHRGLSEEAATSFTEPIDLLFIDGDHSYQGCRKDVMAWLPHLKKGGILVMHDYLCSPGVRKVVEELVAPGKTSIGHRIQNIYWTMK